MYIWLFTLSNVFLVLNTNSCLDVYCFGCYLWLSLAYIKPACLSECELWHKCIKYWVVERGTFSSVVPLTDLQVDLALMSTLGQQCVLILTVHLIDLCVGYALMSTLGQQCAPTLTFHLIDLWAGHALLSTLGQQCVLTLTVHLIDLCVGYALMSTLGQQCAPILTFHLIDLWAGHALLSTLSSLCWPRQFIWLTCR